MDIKIINTSVLSLPYKVFPPFSYIHNENICEVGQRWFVIKRNYNLNILRWITSL